MGIGIVRVAAERSSIFRQGFLLFALRPEPGGHQVVQLLGPGRHFDSFPIKLECFLPLAFVFENYVTAPLADGRLIRVLEAWCPSFDGFFVYYPSRRQMRPALRAFVDFFRVSG